MDNEDRDVGLVSTTICDDEEEGDFFKKITKYEKKQLSYTVLLVELSILAGLLQ